MRHLVAFALACAGCGDNAKEADYLGYDWDGRQVLCSDDIDDLGGAKIDPAFFENQIAAASRGGWALILHAHQPTVGVSLAWLDHVLTWADQYHLKYFTFRDLVPDSEPHAGFALAFDDSTPDAWMLARDTLNKHGAHITIFVSQFNDMTPLGHQEVAILHADGHDIEPHSVNHFDAKIYAEQNGVDAYVANEVLPSFDALVNAGYPYPSAYAYPFGEHTPELDAAILQYVEKVRTTPGQCPWSGWERQDRGPI